MTHSRRRMFAPATLLCLLFLGSWRVQPVAAAATLYVSPIGDDRSLGTLEQPFRTIQHCADVATAGATCFVRTGVYRETITPANSGTEGAPITFTPYNNESVTISGGDVVTDWRQADGQRYVASDVGFFTSAINQAMQVFVDSQMLDEARWPNSNSSRDVSFPTKATIGQIISDDNNRLVFTDPNLTEPDDFWNGATIHLATGINYQDYTATVVAYQRGQLTVEGRSTNNDRPRAGSKYYLFGKLRGLDAAGEWFYDRAARTLTLRTPNDDDPANHTVEMKQRDYAFNLDKKRYITVRGFKLFAATITTDNDAGNGLANGGTVRQNSVALANHITVDRIDARYLSHVTDLRGFGYAQWTNNTGVVLSGSDNVLQNSTLQYSAGNGISVLGERNRVLNNTVSDVNYAATECAGINTGFQNTLNRDHEIGYNTVTNSGRALIMIRSLTNGSAKSARVHHNVLRRAALQTDDMGAIYTAEQNDGNGTEIDHNLISDLLTPRRSVGIYIDNGAGNYRIHHNVVWNAGAGVTLNFGSTNTLVYNNTLIGADFSLVNGGAFNGGDTNQGVIVRNNLLVGRYVLAPDAQQSNNLTWDGVAGSATDPQFVDLSEGQLQLRADSPAIDNGTVLPGYTNDPRSGSTAVTDGKPDLGAYEFGLPAWGAGARTVMSVVPLPPRMYIPLLQR